MPDYLIRVRTDAILDRKGLDRLEDVVYDIIVDDFGGNPTGFLWVTTEDETVECSGGVTDVEATFN